MEDNIIDLIASGESPSNVSSSIKDVLYAKASQRIDAMRSTVGASMFSDDQSTEEE